MYGKIYRKWKRLLAEFWTSLLTLAEYCRQYNLNPKSAGRWKNIFLHRSFDGLPGVVQQYLHEDPLSGHMFIFFNRTFKMVKILYWDGDGYAIWSKRLICGMFHLPPDEYADPGNPLRGVVTAPAPCNGKIIRIMSGELWLRQS